MDDLETLREAWGQPEPPSAAAHAAARAALLERQAASPVRRLAGWWSAGIGLTAAAAAVAVVLASGAGAPAARPGTVAAAQPSAQEILLAAATTAQAQPTGAYWHVKVTWVPNPNASAAEAAAMAAAGDTPGTGTSRPTEIPLPDGKTKRVRTVPGHTIQVKAAGKDAGAVRYVPVPSTHASASSVSPRSVSTVPPPAAPTVAPRPGSAAASAAANLPVLNSTSEEWFARDGRFWTAQPACAAPPGTAVFEGLEGQVGEIALSDGYVDYRRAERLPTDPAALTGYLAKYETPKSALADALVTLLYDAVPPQVRAAAFRALAMFPGAKNLGPVKGGQSLLIPFPKTDDPWIKLVVDPKTSLVRSYATIKGTLVIDTAAWTNQLPRVIPQPPKDACLPGH
jgi:hypothetical protein